MVWVLGRHPCNKVGSEAQLGGEQQRGGKGTPRLSVTWLRQGDMLLASLIFASIMDSTTVGFDLPLRSPSSCARGTLENQVPGNKHHLPGRVSKTSVCEATELTGVSRSTGCSSPGYGRGWQLVGFTTKPSPLVWLSLDLQLTSLTLCRTT